MFAWITATAAGVAHLGYMVQSLVIFNYETYSPKRWHATLMMWGFILGPVIWNFWSRKVLNNVEIVGGICHVLFLIIIIIVLAVLAQHSSSEYVFKTLTHDQSGWTNPAVCWGIGLMTVTFPLTGKSGRLSRDYYVLT